MNGSSRPGPASHRAGARADRVVTPPGGLSGSDRHCDASSGTRFPHAAQAIQVTRRVRQVGGRRWRIVTVYAVTSLTISQASPTHLADYLRGH